MTYIVFCDKVISFMNNMLRIETKNRHKIRNLGITDADIDNYLQITTGSKPGDGELYLRLTGGNMTFQELCNLAAI
jgi:hypothetical protein